MAIKGKTKRSQGRPVRRITPGPRPQLSERRGPWYRAPAFAVTLAVVAAVVTVLAAFTRVQEAWQRDDVRRFTIALQAPMGELGTIASNGAKDKPGMASIADFSAGKLKPAELGRRATNWQTELSAVRDRIDKVTVGEAEVVAPPDGSPLNEVGGRVRMLTAIKDTYVAGISDYEEAAALYQAAAKAPAETAKALVQEGQTLLQRGQAGIDAGASMLAILNARYDLDAKAQMPGESSNAFSARTNGTPQTGLVPGG